MKSKQNKISGSLIVAIVFAALYTLRKQAQTTG